MPKTPPTASEATTALPDSHSPDDMTMTADWAQDLIAELRAKHLDDTDDATRAFCASYAEGDSVAAWERFSADADTRRVAGEYHLLTFADGSSFTDMRQGLDQFYPVVQADVEGRADA